jgi:hypothetical protein
LANGKPKKEEKMTPDKFIIKCPTLEPKRCRGVDMEKALEEIKYSEHCLVLYAPYGKPCQTMFTGYNKEVLAMMVVLLAESKTLRDFFKLALVTTEKLGTKRHGKAKNDFLKEAEAYADNSFDKGNQINR